MISENSVVRTPDAFFENLPDFPFQPNYLKIRSGLNIHYIDEGQGPVVLCLHGEPTWSFAYRKVIAGLRDRFRVIAPDFIGFGRSDKFTGKGSYSYRLHFDVLAEFVGALNLENINLVVHDWGGLVGLGLLGARPERFRSVVIMNTYLPNGEETYPLLYLAYRNLVRLSPRFPFRLIFRFGTCRKLPRRVLKAYKAPFPEAKHQAGVKAWPLLVPLRPDEPGVEEMNRAREVLSRWEKPALLLFSENDPIFRPAAGFFSGLIPGVKNDSLILVKNAGHFIQEDQGKEVTFRIRKFLEANLLP